jgi:hypothetical protein
LYNCWKNEKKTTIPHKMMGEEKRDVKRDERDE